MVGPRLSLGSMVPAPMDILRLVESELAAFRKSGRAIHLAHAARALREARDEVKQLRTAGNVDPCARPQLPRGEPGST